VEKFEVSSEGIIEKVGGRLQFKQIIHKPVILIKAGSGVTVEKLEEVAVRAEKACFIGNTIRNSIEISAQPKVIVL
jgi:organic hydroperoxide reductase OsmC/OhrA